MALDVFVEGSVVALRVHQPARRGAIDPDTIAALAKAVESLDAERTPVAVLLGKSPDFASGGDLKTLHSLGDEEALSVLRAMEGALQRLEDWPGLVLSVVDGLAVGGGVELMLAADITLATPRAHFALRQASVGLTTGWGGTRRLLRRVSGGRARWLLLSGEMLSAADAERLGLVDRIVATEQEGLLAAARLAAMAPAVRAGVLGLAAADGARDVEQVLFRQLWPAPSHREAVAAFLNRRTEG